MAASLGDGGEGSRDLAFPGDSGRCLRIEQSSLDYRGSCGMQAFFLELGP